MNFEQLIKVMTEAHQALQHYARKTVDTSLTVRNWLFGCYLVEFEQNGADRAEYGTILIETCASQLKNRGIKGMSATNLRLCRQLYLTYPQIHQSVTDESLAGVSFPLLPSLSLSNQLVETIPALPAKTLLKQLTYTHLVELVKVEEPLKRTFYEIECLKGNWSVRELKRQIGSLLYERTGLSKDKNKLIKITHEKADPLVSEDLIRNPYIFEFVGLKENDRYFENQLEGALVRHLERFLLELGRGFCFEARQKRIIVDNEHYYVDLVFYHRLLKCHVLIELKNRKFHHQDAGQLNFYLNYFRKYEMSEGDNPPVGILLCTDQDQEHIEFATAGLDNQIFVSKYKVSLPSEEELRRFLIRERQELAVDN